MYFLLFAIHLLISFLIVIIVLLQRSKGGGLSGAFGGVGAGDAAFGGVGVTTFLHKATIYLAVGFMVTSLGLAYLTATGSRTGDSTPVSRGGETVLPVGNTPIVPELPTVTDDAGVVPETDTPTGLEDAIVPPIGDANDDTSGESADETGDSTGDDVGGDASQGTGGGDGNK